MISRRAVLQGMVAAPLISFQAQAEELLLAFNDKRGTTLLNESLSNPDFWKGTSVSKYQGLPYDEIRLKEQAHGYIAYISGNGRHNFQANEVAEGIFRHQDLIPNAMPALKSARYIGRGIDAISGLEYSDIYFLADIKIFFMSVPLRTIKKALGGGRYLCGIELITEDMVSKEKWLRYKQIINLEKEQLVDRWAFQSIVPMEYVFGYYLIEEDEVIGSRVTMVTKMKFGQNANMLAEIGSELPFLLRQGMQAGFIGSVEACNEYLKKAK